MSRPVKCECQKCRNMDSAKAIAYTAIRLLYQYLLIDETGMSSTESVTEFMKANELEVVLYPEDESHPALWLKATVV